MGKHNNLMRLKVDFENQPIIDVERDLNEKEFDDMVGSLRLKFFGR